MTSLTDGRREQDDSGEYSDASQDIEISGNDGGQHESDYDSQGSDTERSEGDPEKQETERRVDDDEDRSNPQYIPKRGTFYEHDDRTAASGEESTNTTSETPSEKKEGPETPTERRRPPRKSESLNKWSHDKFNENEQMPKSRDELVAIYGYDIRNEDAPPHARRNRRYGRGPNKYTRTWEDEEAYRRQVLQTPPNKKPLSPADFPELSSTRPSRRSRARPRSKSQPASNDSSENGSQLRRNASIKTPKQKPVKQNTPRTAPKQINKLADKLTLENLTITTNVNNQGPPQRKVNAVAQIVPVPTNQSTDQGKKKLLPAQPPQSTQQAQSNAQKQQKPQQRQQNTTGGAENRGGSKRYSSLRQRPLAETYSPQQPQQPQQQQQQPPQTQSVQPVQQTQPQPTPQQQPQQTQQQHRYHSEFAGQSAPHQPQQHQGSPAPQIHQQMIHPQVHRNAVNQPHGPSPPHQPIAQPQQHTQQQVRLGIIEQQQMVSHPHHTMHNIPQPHQIGQIQQSQGYAPPAMMPAQYMQPQNATGGVFNPAPIYQPAPAYPHQLYQHHNYATQAGGVTYYSCAEQETASRPHRRPTAAIPIVKPNHAEIGQERPVNSSEKDNIDRIVENMFVRKPWPGTAANDASKDKSERNSQEPQSKDTSQSSSLTSSVSSDSKIEKTEKESMKEKEPERTEDA